MSPLEGPHNIFSGDKVRAPAPAPKEGEPEEEEEELPEEPEGDEEDDEPLVDVPDDDEEEGMHVVQSQEPSSMYDDTQPRVRGGLNDGYACLSPSLGRGPRPRLHRNRLRVSSLSRAGELLLRLPMPGPRSERGA